jgi:7-cyano-7-deazaguanine synthase
MSDNATEKVFVLLSGGVDSSTALALAKGDFPYAEFEAVTIDYGQRHKREIESAKAIADHYKVPHVVIDVKGLMTGMLVDKGEDNEEVPNVSYDELPKGISPTYVTFRNGLMISILAARAQGWVQQQQKAQPSYTGDNILGFPEFNAYIYLGIHADDGANWAYPDCTQEFIGPMSSAVYTGTYNRVRIRSPFTFMPKHMLVQIGVSLPGNLAVPYELTWSCYKGGEKHCGVCPTCRSRKDAFQQLKRAGFPILDPTVYEQ